jgi:hypothetical protein
MKCCKCMQQTHRQCCSNKSDTVMMNKNVTRLTTQGCNNTAISWLYWIWTCWNNLVTSLIISTRLLQVVNSLFQTCWQLGTSSANTTCWQTCYKMWDFIFVIKITATITNHWYLITVCNIGNINNTITDTDISILVPISRYTDMDMVYHYSIAKVTYFPEGCINERWLRAFPPPPPRYETLASKSILCTLSLGNSTSVLFHDSGNNSHTIWCLLSTRKSKEYHKPLWW